MRFEDCERLANGFRRMKFDEFAQVLKDSIGADYEYAQGVWGSFAGGPLLYCTSRRPDRQGRALIYKAWELGE